MQPGIFLLSIFNEYAELIRTGVKKWEFRQNPKFGRELQNGDIIFIVSTFKEQSRSPVINCICEVEEILRENEINLYFGKKETNHWLETGCKENSSRDWTYFQENILTHYATAIRLRSAPLEPPIDTGSITHTTKHTSWKGTGFTSAEKLHRFRIAETQVTQYLRYRYEDIWGDPIVI